MHLSKAPFTIKEYQKIYSLIPKQTLAVFVIVPWLTNWLGLHDALVSCLGHFSLLVMFVVPAVVPSRTW